jgi:L-glutamine-phosphate cytidylyltransferase
MTVAPAVRQAVILAAGRGSRMGVLTGDCPKCLCLIAGRPILSWTLAALRAHGVDQVLMVVGWQRDKLAGWADVQVVNPRWAESNMVRSLQLAGQWLSRAPTLVLYGDGAYGRRALARVLAPTEADIAVPGDLLWHSLWKRRFVDPLRDAETWMCRDKRLIEIGSRTQDIQHIQAQFMGLLKTTPAGWAHISDQLMRCEVAAGVEAVDRMDVTGMLKWLIANDTSIECIDVDGGWVEIDSDGDRQAVENGLNDPSFQHDFRY